MDKLTHCRACLAPDPFLYLPLGPHAPAQMLISPEDLAKPQPAFGLNTQVCLSCGLVQVADQIPSDFFRHYLYVPSGAATMHTHFEGLANRLVALAGKDRLIVDIGCNDGLMLGAANALGARTLGIDPAANIVEVAKKRGVEVHVDYFTPKSAEHLRATRERPKIIATSNTFNHIGDLHSFMRAIDIFLADDGYFVIEVPRAKEMIDNALFDNMYHEHVAQFSLLSIVKLGAFFGMEVVDVDRLSNIHGGSMRVFLARKAQSITPKPIVAEMLKEEAASGMLDKSRYIDLAKSVDAMGANIRKMLSEFKAQGKKIAGYGASARGNTLVTYFGLGTDYLDFLVDKNPLKQGLYSPNLRIPIKPVEAIAAERPDVLFVLAWNFFDEIKVQQQAFLDRGGKFVVPLPTLRVVG